MPHVLIVDDELPSLNALQRQLRAQFGPALGVDACLCGRDGLVRVQQRRYAVVLSDLRMPEMDGLEFLQRLSAIQPEAVRLLLTGAGDLATAQQAVNEIGVYRYLSKPCPPRELQTHLAAALAHAARQRACQEAALAWQVSQGQCPPLEAELRRLEALEPGITRVEWGSDGAVIMPECPGLELKD